MRIFKRLLACALALAFLAALNAAIAFAVVPFGSKSELVWTDYSAEESIDTVTVGTSLMQQAINPELLDELCGCKSYCLATPNQTLEESFIAIQTAHEDHGIKRAILGVSSVDLQAADPPSLGDAFFYNRARVADPAQNASAVWQVLTRYGGAKTQDSLNALFPWIYNHVALTPARVLENAQARWGENVHDAASLADPVWHYVAKGYGECDATLDYDSDLALPFFSEERDDGATDTKIDPDRIKTLEDIYSYCDERGIELVAVSVPMPAYNVVDGDGYYELHDNVESAFSGIGRTCYDFNFARAELFDSQPDYYFDTIHMNAKGARAFTESFAKFLDKLESGEDVSALFCDADEQRASVDHISAVFAESSVDAAGIHVDARAATGSGVDVEYQLCALDDETQTWQVVADWSDSAAFDYAPPDRGVVNLRVSARIAGTRSDGDRHRNLYAYY